MGLSVNTVQLKHRFDPNKLVSFLKDFPYLQKLEFYNQHMITLLNRCDRGEAGEGEQSMKIGKFSKTLSILKSCLFLWNVYTFSSTISP